ncbi:MAG: hypothetical protein J6N52_11775 [Clostridia bacterium]|nr:hypothetical protein [Clostridia bacterium]
MHNKKCLSVILSVALSACCIWTSLPINTASADSYEDAVILAESTKLQSDIDAAQVMISNMEDTAAKNALEVRLDLLQNKVDSAFIYDVSGRENGFGIYVNPEGGWNVTVQDDPLGKYGKVMQQHYVAAAPGGWNQAVFGEPISGRVTIEESIMFACTGKEARAFRAYLGLGSGSDQRLFSFYPSDHDYCQGLYLCHGNSDWLRMPGSENAVTRDKWYDIKIVIDTETKEYEAYLSCDGELIGSVKDTAYNSDYSKGLASVSLAPEGSSSTGDDYLYYTGVRAYIETPEMAARKLLVKAERSRNENDIMAAAKSIYSLTGSAEKDGFVDRLTAIGGCEQDVLVSEALETKNQSDIDAAQISVSSMEDGEKKKAFENKLDALQKSKDALYVLDFAEYSAGDTGFYISNNTSTVIKEENGNKYLDAAISSAGTGGINEIYKIPENAIGNNSFTLEQKLKFNGKFNNFEFNIDIDGTEYYFLERIVPYNNFGGYNSGGDFIYQEASGFVPGRWYNFILSYDKTTGKYTKSIVDVETGHTEQKTNLDLQINPPGWKAVRYRLSGNSEDSTGVVGVDDFVLTVESDVSAARNATVQAERSKDFDSIIAAMECIAKLDAGADKDSFTARINNIPGRACVGSVRFYNGDIVIDSLVSGAVTAKTTVINKGDKTLKARFIIALYDETPEGKRLVSAQTSGVTPMAPGDIKELSESINIADISSGSYILKAFVWDDITALSHETVLR